MTDNHEQLFWGNCQNTFGEELKQMKYAELMWLLRFGDGRSPFNFWGYGLRWVDFGGGPSSLLLKMKGTRSRCVIDPILSTVAPRKLPSWVYERYTDNRIFPHGVRADAELPEFLGGRDIALCYNVLQHVEDPDTFVANMLALSKVQVVFEWIDLPPHDGHPNMLTKESLGTWFGPGYTGELKGENGCWGKFWCKPLRTTDLADLGAEPFTVEAAKAVEFPNP